MAMLSWGRLTHVILASVSLLWNTCPTTPCSSWSPSFTRLFPMCSWSRARPRTPGPMWMLIVVCCCRWDIYYGFFFSIRLKNKIQLHYLHPIFTLFLCSTMEWLRWIITLSCLECPEPLVCYLSWYGVEPWASPWSAPSPWAQMDWWHWWEQSQTEEEGIGG